MKRQLNGEEFRLLCRSLEELGMIKIRSRLKQESTYINGITFYRSSDSPEGKIITFAEDDLKAIHTYSTTPIMRFSAN